MPKPAALPRVSMQIYVSPELRQAIERSAQAQGLTMTEWVRRALAEKVSD